MAEIPCPQPGPRSDRSPGGVLREIQVNLLECKVCFERFCSRQRERRPQNLPCGHVLCLECITALAHPLLKKLECPFCRQLCRVDSTTRCRALCDLQELLRSWRPGSSAPALNKAKQGGAGLSSTGLRLSAAFGGWGTLINPTGVAVLGSSGTIVVVHDGEKRVSVFGPQGRELNGFGRREQADGGICYPVDVAVTPCGFVVVTDAGDKAVKVFTSRGNHVLAVRDAFQMPWGVDTDSCGHILVSDVQAGTLSRIKVDYGRRVAVERHTPVSELQRPKAVACCPATGDTAVVEHLTGDRHTRLKVFTKDFHLLYETDTFSLTLRSSVRLTVAGVAFDEGGDLLVADSAEGTVWSLRRTQGDWVLTPLAGDRLIRPVGLVSLNNALLVLDGGDHTVKIYGSRPEAGSVDLKLDLYRSPQTT